MGWPLPHQSIGVLPSFASHMGVAEFILANAGFSEVDTDTQLQLAIAGLRQRRCTNCKRGAKAMLWIAKEGQEGPVLLHDRYEIVRRSANRRIKHIMKILR
jgi:hypothetical protein